MESTIFSTKINLTETQLRPRKRDLMLLFYRDPRLRPPVLEEMLPDLRRVMASAAQKYCDSTTPHLHFDELMGEGNLKLAELVSKGHLEKQATRVNFFKYATSCINNNHRSRVQKYRFTEKRTGQKPPPREQRQYTAPTENAEKGIAPAAPAPTPEYHKNVDLSLDDPDLALQVSDSHDNSDVDSKAIDWGFSAEAADYAFHLTPVEKLVFHEMLMPSEHARVYAEDAALFKSKGGKTEIKIKDCHKAKAIGITPELFAEAVLSIQSKIKAYRMATTQEQDQEAKRNFTIAHLKQIFVLQIPPDTDDCVVRRMLTMAARDQFDKMTPQLSEMLLEVGAKIPRSIGGDKLACYGVLYQKNCRQCNTCDLRHSCNVEASNIGLTKMSISPKLLGARQTRTPAVLARYEDEMESTSKVSTEDEAEIIEHLDETFQRDQRNGKPHYFHSVGTEKNRRYLFCIEGNLPLKLRFCNPSDALKSKLEGKQKTWFAPAKASLSEIISLIEQHSAETFE